jgi:hypothetical protein
MKKLLYFFAILLFVSCTKKNSDPAEQPGILGSYLKANPEIIIQKTTQSMIGYQDGYATYRGYQFKPSKDMKITEIGGRIAQNGTYKIIISNTDGGWTKDNGWTEILTDSITITNTGVFQYKKITQNIILKAGKNYVIRYFNKSHDSVFDAGLGSQPGIIELPLIIDDIEIDNIYYSYELKITGGYLTMEQGLANSLGGILRGLVDFKYELVQ